MFSDLVFVMILIYFACLAGMVYSSVLILKTKSPCAASLAATLFIMCVITIYVGTCSFIEEVELLPKKYYSFINNLL